jgi:hypothetical protein
MPETGGPEYGAPDSGGPDSGGPDIGLGPYGGSGAAPGW